MGDLRRESATYLCTDLAELVKCGVAHGQVAMMRMLNDLESYDQLTVSLFGARSKAHLGQPVALQHGRLEE